MAPETLTIHVLPHDRIVRAETGQSLLDAVLAAGIRAPHSCTLGYCGSCRAVLRRGSIAYPSGQIVEAATVAGSPEEIMLCIARPRTDVQVEIRFAQTGWET